MRLVFMGTPGFALPSLRLLHQSKHEIVSVVTTPDKPVGRGLKVKSSEVKIQSQDFGLKILQPERIDAPQFVQQLASLQADLFVVVAFRILPATVFTLPPKGTINLHSSYLPKYRGAAPINWAIINGETETGVTTFFIDEKVDTGNIILQKKVRIGDDETAGQLHDRLAEVGADLLLQTVNEIEAGAARRHAQEGSATRAPKLTPELGNIRWEQSNTEIRNLIRGLNPVPGAYSFIRGARVKIFSAAVADESATANPGAIVKLDKKNGEIAVATGSGSLNLTELQPQGKRRMSAVDFLNGYSLKTGDRFSRDPIN